MRLLRASLAAAGHETMSPRPRDRVMFGVGVRLDAVLEAGRAVLRAWHRRGGGRRAGGGSRSARRGTAAAGCVGGASEGEAAPL